MRRPYIYVASSWRNEELHQAAVRALRDGGAAVYAFREPARGASGFDWREIHPGWPDWTPAQFIEALEHPIARDGFRTDMNALKAADLVVLVLSCGRSAHLELGYAVGAGKPTGILLTGHDEAELMYAMADCVTAEVQLLCFWAAGAAEALGFDSEWRNGTEAP